MFRCAIVPFAFALLTLTDMPAQAVDTPAFVGRWDCAGATIAITSDRFVADGKSRAIKAAEQGADGSWTLLVDGAGSLTLSNFVDRGMHYAVASGESHDCTKLRVKATGGGRGG